MGVGRIGKYERLDVLGHGTSGVVYLAWDTLLRRQVALKEIRAAGPEMDRMLEEARVLERLKNHPNIVQVHSVDVAEGVILIDMELIRGQNLADLLRDRAGKPLAVAEALRIAIDVLEALGYAHERRIIHRDIKPANILIGANGIVKLTDFGLAEALGTGSLAGGGGTYPYMAPEDFDEDAASDYRSDLWAVGVVLYEMLAGRRPFAVTRSRDPFSWSRAIREETPPRLSSLRRDISSELDSIQERALAKQKGSRYPTASLLADSLRAALLSAPSPSPPPIPAAPPDATESTVPFIFQSGGYFVYSLDELLLGAAKYWDEGRAALIDGRFERFLRAIEEPYIADLAAELSGRSNENADRRLREFLERSRADDPEPDSPVEKVASPPEDATLPLIRVAAAERPRHRRFGRRERQTSTATLPALEPDQDNSFLARIAEGRSVFTLPTPLRTVPQERTPPKVVPPPSKKAESTGKTKAKRNIIWWYWWYLPLLVISVTPPTLAMSHGNNSNGAVREVLGAWSLTGILAAMLLLVGVGARAANWARFLCFIPLGVGLMAGGALVSTIIGPHPNPDRLIRVGIALLAPLFLLLVQAATIKTHWRQWAWATALLTGLIVAQFALHP